MFGRMISSTPWGFIADQYGRVRVLRYCTVISACLTMYFGIAPNYWVAVLVRILTGFFNPVVALVKSILPKLVDKSETHRAMSFISITWAFGLSTGPVIGGWLSRWCCGDHPYLLPCLVCGCLQLSGLIPLRSLEPFLIHADETVTTPKVKRGGGYHPNP